MSDKTEKELKMVPIRQMSDEDLADKISSTFHKARGNKLEDTERNHRYRNIYKALNSPDDVINESGEAIIEDKSKYSDTYLAIGASTVDTATASLYNHLFSVPDYMEIEGNDWEDDLVSMKITAHQLKRHEEMGLQTKVYEALQMATCFDYCVTMTCWKLRAGYVNKKVKTEEVEKIGGVAFRRKRVKMKTEWIPNAIDRSDFQVLDYFNCYHDISSKNGFEDSTFFIDTYEIPIEELILKQKSEDAPWGKYKNVDKVIGKHLEDSGFTKENADDPVWRGSKEINDRVQVVRYWTHDQVAEYCLGFIIRRTDLDGLPLQLWKVYHLPSEFKGMGVVQRIERNQYDVNEIINIKRDFQNLQLNPVAVIDEEIVGAGDGDVELYSGKTFTNSTGKPAGDMMKFFQPGIDISQGSSEELSLQMGVIKDTSGFTGENQSGQFSQGRKTAREAVAVAAGANSKVSVIASRLEIGALVPAYQKLFVLEQMNLTQEDQFKYMGSEGHGWLVIRPEDYRWNAIPRFTARGVSHMINKDNQLNQFLLAVDRTFQYFPDMADREALYAKMWQLLDPKDYLNFVRDPRDKQHKIPANMENLILSLGQKVQRSPEDDDQKHSASHRALKTSKEYPMWTEDMKQNLEDHLQEHDLAGLEVAQSSPQIQQTTGQDDSDQFRGQRGLGISGLQ